MKKNDLLKIITLSAIAAVAAAGGAVILSQYKKYKNEESLREIKSENANAYILGGGMSAMAAALYLVRDCKLKPRNVHIFTDKKYERGNGETGYICRRGKIINEKKSPNFFELIQEVHSLDISDFTVCDEILNIYTARGAMRPITLIEDDGNVVDISKIRLDKDFRRAILNLMRQGRDDLIITSIGDALPDEFFNSRFWKLVSAAYGFGKGSNAYEFVNALVHIDDALSGTMPSDFDRSEEIIEPLTAHLVNLGVDVCKGACVTDVDFKDDRADAVHYIDHGVRKSVYLNEHDICVFPTDEIAECETFGSFNESAPKGFSVPYMLWEKLAEKNPAFKNPSALFTDGDEHLSVEFTATLSNHLLPELIDKVTCGALGKDGVIVLDNSNWKLTVCAVPPSHFKDRSDDTAILWGYAANGDADGGQSGKPITECSGAEILYELISCFNLSEAWDEIRETVINVIPCHRRYDKAYLAPVPAKLEIIPIGISNLAVSGEFTDGSGSVFTEEFSVSTAKTAAYRLMNYKKRVFKFKKGK